MFEKLTKQSLKKIPIDNKMEFVHRYNDIDLDLTMQEYKEGEGLKQVTSKYPPGPCGRLLLEQGREALLGFKLREKGMDKFILELIKHLIVMLEDETKQSQEALSNFLELQDMLQEFENKISD
jgi:hypothetical protein